MKRENFILNFNRSSSWNVLVYMCKGHAAGAHYNKHGSGSNFLCLPERPQWKNYIADRQGNTGKISGTEYQLSNSGVWRNNVFSEITTTVIHLVIIQRRVHFATWEVGQQSSWFQQEHSVRMTGPYSTQDIWFPRLVKAPTLITAAATFAGTRHRRSQSVEHNKTKHCSILFKSSVDHCHVQYTQLGESWPVWFASSDVSAKSGEKLTILFPVYYPWY